MEILNESLLSSCYDHQDSDDCRSFSVFDANNHGYLVAKGDIDSLDERSIAQYTKNIPKNQVIGSAHRRREALRSQKCLKMSITQETGATMCTDLCTRRKVAVTMLHLNI